MLPILTNETTITTTALYEHICSKSNTAITEATYISFLGYVDTVLTAHNTRTEFGAQITATSYIVNGIATYDLTLNACNIIAAGLNNHSQDILRDLDYLFNGMAPVTHFNELNADILLPIVDTTDVYEMDSLQFVEIINKGRIEWNAQNPDLKQKPAVTQDNAIKIIKSTFSRVSENSSDLGYLDCRYMQDSYINTRGKACNKLLLTEPLALASGMAYDGHTRDMVQNEMYKLRYIASQTKVVIVPPVLSLTTTDTSMPALVNETYITMATAIATTKIDMDEALLIQNTNVHNMYMENTGVDGVEVNAFHSFIYAITYNIPVNTWDTVAKRHTIA